MNKEKETSIAETSSYSLFIYLVFVLIGFSVDLFFTTGGVFSVSTSLYVGLAVMGAGSFLVFWSNHTGNQYEKHGHAYQELGEGHLKKGAFRFSRNPHYLGLGILTIGFGVVINSLPVFLCAVISFVLVNMYIVPKEERILRERHGDAFEAYKQKTKRWF